MDGYAYLRALAGQIGRVGGQDAARGPPVIVLSHWPHVAQQVQQQVRQLVAELVPQHVASVKAPLDNADLSDFDAIWHSDGYGPSTTRQPLKAVKINEI